MSNVYLACKSFVFVLVVLSTAGFVAGTPISKEQKDGLMLLFGKALYGEEFDINQLKEYKDALADKYTNMGIHANHSSLEKNRQIVMSRLGDTSIWKMIFPNFPNADHTDGTVIVKLPSVADIKKTLQDYGVEPLDIVGFNIERIGVTDTKINENGTKKPAGLLSTAVRLGASGLGVSAPVIDFLAATFTTRRCKLVEIYPANSSRGNFIESKAEKIRHKYATKWANKNSLGIESAQYPMADSKEFQNRISEADIEPLVNKMQAAAKKLGAKALTGAKVRIGLLNILDTKVELQPQPTDNFFAYLVCEGLTVETKHNLQKVLFGENFMDHQFEDNTTQVTDTNCHLCHSPLSASTNHCKDCNMVVHKVCAVALRESKLKPRSLAYDKMDVFLALQKCFHFIEDNIEEGIYRICGAKPEIEYLKSVFDNGKCMSNAKLWIHAHENSQNIFGVVKKYLGMIPNLIPSELFEKVRKDWKHSGEQIAQIAANEKTANNEQSKDEMAGVNNKLMASIEQNNKANVILMKEIINSHHPIDQVLLKLILKHLNGLLFFVNVTKMTASNLITALGPTIVGNMGFGNVVLEAMFTQFEKLDIEGKWAI